MRPRDPARLTSAPYDLVVIGGGIVGLAAAYEAASRGLRAALIEAGDFGGGASFNHQKTVHGGLRALQTLSIRRARAAIRERRALARIAPWLLRPLPFIVGTYRSVTRGRIAFRAAFALDELLGRDRNAGVEPELHLPRARLLSRTATLKLFPGIRQEQLTGGAQWYDYQMVENDRLTLAFAAGADRAGADLANYVEARGIRRREGSGWTVRAHDLLQDADFDIESTTVINAAGARAGEIMRWLGSARQLPLMRAMNLVTAKPASDIALAAPDPRGRMLTLVPWRGRAIVGTGQSEAMVDPGSEPSWNEVERLVADSNHAFPALKLTAADITLVHHGLVPAARRGDGSVELLPESQILDGSTEGAPGALTIVGAKYTTARGTAERAVDRLSGQFGKPVRSSRSAVTVLPLAGIADHEALAIETGRGLRIELDTATLRHLIGRYAEAAADVVKLIAERPATATPLAPGAPTIAAEVIHVIRNEMAVRLTDIVLRRTTMGAGGHPGAAVLSACAHVAATELGWDAAKASGEIAEVEGFYRLV